MKIRSVVEKACCEPSSRFLNALHAHTLEVNMSGLRVKQSSIQIRDGNTVVNSPAMINELIHNSSEVLQLLGTSGAKVSLGDISVDADGRIVIDNPEFRKAVESVLSTMTVLAAGDANGICGLRC
jgi:hypothetical protein